jgi:DNA mismatch repair protein MutH
MERDEALRRLSLLRGKDLRALADKYEVTVWTDRGTLNKGWAGHVCERHLGLPLNSAQAPNFGSWELKLVSLKRLKNGRIVPKETMAITMIDRVHVAANPFETSHLFTKLRKMVVVARMYESREEESSALHAVGAFDLSDEALLRQVKADYDEVRRAIRTRGFDALSGRMGVLVQPRTKGPGHTENRTRAFYARTGFVARMLGLTPPLPDGGVE